MNRYWLGWYEPGEDYRPIKWPLPDTIKYWCTAKKRREHYTIVEVP